MNQPAHRRPKYVPNTGKAVEVILWLATREPGIDIYHIVKAAFYADKAHVSKYGRPIVGDEYEAWSYGPVPRVIYGLLRGSPIEVLAAGLNGKMPFTITENFQVHPGRAPNLRRLSKSDIEALDYGFSVVHDKSFDELVEMTHDDPAFVNADGGVLDYRDFLDANDKDRDAKAKDLSEVAQSAVI